MFYIYRMLQLAFWHKAMFKKEPWKIKQRVKLRKSSGLTATPINPVAGSPLDCSGTIYKMKYGKITGHMANVKWDNNNENSYPPEYLIIVDFPLKFLPRLPRLNKDNPNSTFKELEAYMIMEKEWLEHERRLEQRRQEMDQANNNSPGNDPYFPPLRYIDRGR